MSPEKRPLVIRRSHSGHEPSHGVWKIAYADFMTALMSFFLVMWLLGGLSSEELKSVSTYFSIPLKVALAGGDRTSASDSAIPGGGDDPTHSSGEVRLKSPQNRPQTAPDRARLKRLMAELQAQIEQDPRLSRMSAQIELKIVPDGLLIQVSDSRQRPMFKIGSAQLLPDEVYLLTALAPRLASVDNRIVITGYTDDLPYAAGPTGYGNWELSVDRANAARRALMVSGLAPARILRVIGAADTSPLEPGAADAPVNRRISLLLLDPAAERRIQGSPAKQTSGSAKSSTAASALPPALPIRPERR